MSLSEDRIRELADKLNRHQPALFTRIERHRVEQAIRTAADEAARIERFACADAVEAINMTEPTLFARGVWNAAKLAQRLCVLAIRERE